MSRGDSSVGFKSCTIIWPWQPQIDLEFEATGTDGVMDERRASDVGQRREWRNAGIFIVRIKGVNEDATL